MTSTSESTRAPAAIAALYSGSARRRTDHELLNASLGLIAPVADDVVAAFYRDMFAAHPELRGMFPRNMSRQRDKLLKAIVALAAHYDQPTLMIEALVAMGRDHGARGTPLSHYAWVEAALVDVLRRFSGNQWNDGYEGAWRRAYTFAAGIMMAAGVDVDPAGALQIPGLPRTAAAPDPADEPTMVSA